MPGGINLDAAQAYVAFSAIKFVGYSIAGVYLSRAYPDSRANFLLVGFARTVLGVIFGVSVGLIGLYTLNMALALFLVGLIPIRYLEWWITIRIFFDRNAEDKAKMFKNVCLGIAWSFVLDFPAIFGFLATGGLWLC